MERERELNTDLAVIILTHNEEKNLAQALVSVCGWAGQVFVLDSFSTDRTLEIAQQYDCMVFQNIFEDYSKQRNYALTHLPISTEWVLFLDADEWLPADLKQEISELIVSRPNENGFHLKFRLIWMEKWIRRGYYPTWVLRLFRYGKGRCEDRGINEHYLVEGEVGYLKHDLIHEDRKGVTEWIAKHNRYATREAGELLKNSAEGECIEVRFFGTQAQRKRWIRYRVWNHLPPLIRPFLFFFYRYILIGGFLEGQQAFIYHFLHGLWFHLLIDIKYLELKKGHLGQKRFIKRGNKNG